MRNHVGLEPIGLPAMFTAPHMGSAVSGYLRSHFLEAIRAGDLPAVHTALRQNPWLLETDLGGSPILLALRHRRRAVANVLAFLGKKLNIFEAAALGCEKRLLEWIKFHPSTVHARDEYGWSALHHASANHHQLIVKALLEAGADPNMTTPKGGTRAIDLAIHPKIVARLKSGARNKAIAA